MAGAGQDRVVKKVGGVAPKAAPKKPPEGIAGGESLDKIRDILFGNQVREYDKRFAGVEDRLRRESQALRDEMTRRLDSLESYIKNEVGSILDRIKKEQQERGAGLKELGQGLEKTGKALDEKTGGLADELSKSERKLREELLQQSKSLTDEIRRRHEEASTALERAAAELRHSKTDRADLSAMLAELAVRIGEDLEEAGA